MSDVTDRLDKIEAALALNQLPPSLEILKRKLESTWQPDAAVLLQPGSITPELIASAINIGNVPIALRGGTFAGTTSASGELVATVPHGLGRIPTAVTATPNSASGTQITARVIALTSTTFDVYVVRSAAAAIAVGGYWIAIG